MASSEIIRHIDTIARDKEIDRDALYEAIEQAVAMALQKKYAVDDIELTLDRETGQWNCNYEIDLETEGRILAQSVKQAIFSKVREAERDVLYDEYETKIGEIVTGTVQRFEGDAVIVNLGRNMEGILPRAEKVRGESYNIGDRIRSMVLEVKKVGPRVKVILTRGHKDLVRCLFELEVPEIADGTITIRRIEREPGYRTKLAVHSADDKVDCVGACVGVRGTRIKSIIDELNGERIDIIRWNEDPEVLIANSLKPADISHIELDAQSRKALVLVDEDQLSLAIGRKGQNVRLASKLTNWEIDIMTRAELEKTIADEESSEAETPAAETPAAETPAGETPAGETPAGDAEADTPETVEPTAESSETEGAPTASDATTDNQAETEPATESPTDAPADEPTANENPTGGSTAQEEARS